MDRMIGKVINEYEILEMLGRGGMGVVYRAHDTVLDRDVALKTMDMVTASDPKFLRRFQSEARALAKLNDPNIVSVFSLLETPDGVCIVMELVKGRTLGDLLDETPLLPVPRVIRIFRQVFAALDHAHKEGVIHRDIKPANIMLAGDDVVKITDFGLAKIQSADGMTLTKETAGTLFYMSPEQIRGLGQVDHRGDVYSAGMALYECLAGDLPFNNDSSEYTIANMIVEGLIPHPDRINAALPGDLARIVMKAIEKDVARRYQSAGEVLSALQRFSEGGTGAAGFDLQEMTTTQGTGHLPPPRADDMIRRSGWKLSSAILGGMFLLGTLVIVLRPFAHPLAGKPDTETDRAGAQSVADRGDVAAAHGPGESAKAAGESQLRLIAIPEGEAAVDNGPFQVARAAVTFGVSAGRRTVRFRSSKGVVRDCPVEVRPGEVSTIRCYFQGVVRIEATLDHISAPAAIVVDGVMRREMAPGKITVAAGKHRIGVRMENYVSVPAEETVTVEPSFESPKDYNVTFRMKREQ